MERLRQLIHEIHRRSLWQVLGIYVVASWAVLQVVDTLGGALRLPDWTEPFALVLLIVGLPVVLATAFVQEGISGREVSAAETPSPVATPASGLLTWRNALGGGVLAFALWGVVAAGYVLLGGGVRAAGEVTENVAPIERSVAVLPFVNMSGDPDNEYFSDGITEELLNALAQLPDLRVPGRTSSFAFKGQNVTIQQIADTLGVAHILEGSVRRDGERVLITAQLIDAQTDAHLWSETFERELTDIFAIQREIATAIADQLQVTLSGNQQTRLVAEGTESTEAHEAYLRGRYFWNQRTGESLLAAIEQFERAIEQDPEYAEAYSGLADSYSVLSIYATVPDPRAVLERALDVARQAVALAPDLGMARTSLAWALTRLGEWDDAGREFELAIALSPGYAPAHQWYGVYLRQTGRAEETMVAVRRAVEADPVSQIVNLDLAWALHYADRSDEAIDQMRQAIELDRSWPRAWQDLSWMLLEAGEYDEALDAALNWAGLVGADSAMAREQIEAAARYKETGEAQSFSFSTTAIWYAATGQRERALEIIERLVQEREYFGVATTHVRAAADLLGGDPRYQALLEEAGITR